MFTGLIEDVGSVKAIEKTGQDWLLRVKCGFAMDSIKLGDSIAINGACLTVINKEPQGFAVQISRESVNKTTFAKLTPGAILNMERALLVGGRLDGHMVQGHVDAVGKVERITPRGRSIEIWFTLPREAGRYVIAKGSIAVDGVSLTVNEVVDGGSVSRFSVNIIPHTQKKTTLAGLAPGHQVNIETDLLGRYVERLMQSGGRHGRPMDEAYLRKKGF
ncbi:MAG: riboflavin synthase [Magnetococcales bacterium]|nr:riboflavin synthase [Magnetococcales bacterium]